MAEETLPKPADPAPSTEVVAAEAAADTKPEEEVKKDEEVTPPPAPAVEEKAPAEEAAAEALEAAVEEAEVTQSASFKEESNVVADLEDPEKKALDELKQLIQTALANNEFTPLPPPPPPAAAAAAAEETPGKEEEKAEEKTGELKKEEEAAAKTEEAAPVAEEAPKTEEPKAEEAPPAAEEPPKTEELKAEEASSVTEEPLKTAAPAAPAQPSEAEEKLVVIEEGDGSKIVEAIDETIVVPEVTEETRAAEAEAAPEASAEPPEEVFIWGIPLLGDEKSDTVLLKFLRARDFKVKDALAMIKNAVIWRKQFGTDILLEEDLEVPELEKAVFYHGFDKEGHPVCYNVFGEFQDKEFYGKAFGDEEKREKFLRWRIQYLEKGIRQLLDFTPGAVSTMVQVTDLKNTPGPGKKELRVATKKALALLQDNYPEFVAKQIFINVPWWYLAYNRVMSPFFTQRTKSKFVFAGPSKSAETLFKYIAPEQVPVQYGGLSKDSDPDFTTTDAVTEVTIKPASKHIIEISASEGNLLVWELRVLGWEVSYGAEFVPTAEDGYTVIVQKARKFLPTDEPYVKNSFKIGEPGKVLLTIDNATSKKKKLLYRSKEKSSAESN